MTYDRDSVQPCSVCGDDVPSPEYRASGKCKRCRVGGPARAMMKTVKAKLQRGNSRMGATPWWLVDEQGNLLNTEPVCITYDNWHKWFELLLENITTEYLGLK